MPLIDPATLTDDELAALLSATQEETNRRGKRRRFQDPYASLALEAIGDDTHEVKAKLQARHRMDVTDPRVRRALLGNAPKAWVARLVGVEDGGALVREFVRGQKDYSRANSVGSRGVWIHYALAPGLYEVNEPQSWSRARRYLIRVADGRYSEVSPEDAAKELHGEPV